MADPTVTQLAASTSTTATTTVSGWTCAAGELLVLAVSSDDYRTTAGANRPESSGWTLISDQHTFLGHAVWYKIATGSETSVAYTIGSAAKSAYALIKADNIDSSGTVVDASSGQFAQSSASTYTTPSVATSTGRRFGVASIGGSNNSATAVTLSTWLNSYVEISDATTTSPQDVVGLATLAFDGGGTTSSGASYSGAQQARTGIIAVFKVAAGGSFNGDATLSATATITTAGVVNRTAGATLSATDSIANTGVVGTATTSSIAATAAVTAAGSVTSGVSASASLAATDTVTAGGIVGRSTTSSLSATDTITTGGVTGTGASATIAATATITTAGSVGAAGGSGATLAATDSVTAAGVVASSAGSSVAAVVTITTTGQVGKAASASVAGTATLTAAGTVIAGGVSASGTVAGVATIVTAGTVGLSTGATLTGAATIAAVGTSPKFSAATLAAVATVTTAGSVADPSADRNITVIAASTKRDISASIPPGPTATTRRRWSSP